jgi:thiol-disulfide isomerase/thioredoxin
MLRNIIVSLVILGGLTMTALITYNTFFYQKPAESLEERGETAVLTSKTILNFGRGAFVDKREELHPNITAPAVGYIAPDFELPDGFGKLVKLSSLRGKPIFLNFWATWCPPCRKEMPDLQAFHDKHSEKIQMLGVNWGETSSEGAKFLAEFGVTYLNLFDSDGKMFVLYQLSGLPTSFFVDEVGIIRGVWLGPMSAKDIEIAFQKTTKALEEPAK